MYPILNKIMYFINKNFVKKTKYPIISIILFIIAVVLNSIQYSNNRNYLQNKIIKYDTSIRTSFINTTTTNKNGTRPTNTNSMNYYTTYTNNTNNALLFIYDMIGINGFIDNTPAHIFFLIATYFLLSLVEMNIGYLPLLFLLFISLMFITFWSKFQNAICQNQFTESVGLHNPLYPYCCGSVILCIALGFVLYITQNNLHNIFIRLLIILIIIFIFFMFSLYEKYGNNADMEEGSQKTCKNYTWHASSFAFGVLCASILSNSNSIYDYY